MCCSRKICGSSRRNRTPMLRARLAWMLLDRCLEPLSGSTTMQVRPQSLMFLAAFAVLGTGCASTATSGDDARNARLPVGVTLLDTDRSQCQGTVAIDEASIRTA